MQNKMYKSPQMAVIALHTSQLLSVSDEPELRMTIDYDNKMSGTVDEFMYGK